MDGPRLARAPLVQPRRPQAPIPDLPKQHSHLKCLKGSPGHQLMQSYAQQGMVLTLHATNHLPGASAHLPQSLRRFSQGIASDRARLGECLAGGRGNAGQALGGLRLEVCGPLLRGGRGVCGRRGIAEAGASDGKSRVPQHGA